MSSVDAASRGIAGAVLGTMRNLGMLLGEAAAAAVLASAIRGASAEAVPQGIVKALSLIGIGAALIAVFAIILTSTMVKRRPESFINRV